MTLCKLHSSFHVYSGAKFKIGKHSPLVGIYHNNNVKGHKIVSALTKYIQIKIQQKKMHRMKLYLCFFHKLI